MQIVLVIFTFLLSLSAFSKNIVSTQIYGIDHGDNPKDDDLIFLMTGEVLKIKPGEKSHVLMDIRTAIESNSFVKIQKNSKSELLSFEIDYSKSISSSEEVMNELDYTPTILNSYQDANSIFQQMRPRARKDSQCYNRAHVWSYEGLQKHNWKSMKVFIFYTRKYIREYNFYWWFHVTPYALVNENGTVVERIMDYQYTKRPLYVKEWTDIFMRNRVNCPVIQKYSDYSQHEQEAYCYLYKESMFYYQPLDLKAKEDRGATKSTWINWEVKNAYIQGFGISRP